MDLEQFSAHRTMVETAGGPVACVDVGTGPAAVFVHGILVSSYLWHDVIGRLRGERRCVAFDLPGHGRTPPRDAMRLPDLAALLGDVSAALGLDEFDLVGNDTGGAICQLYAAGHPDRVRTLTLTNCDVHDQIPPEAFQPFVEEARNGRMAPALAAMYAEPDQARAALGASLEHPELLSDDEVRELFGGFSDLAGARAAEHAVLSLDSADLMAAEPGLRALDVPTLIAWGTGDIFFDVRWAHWLNDTIKGATGVTEIGGGKLFWPAERAAELVSLLREHWESLR